MTARMGRSLLALLLLLMLMMMPLICMGDPYGDEDEGEEDEELLVVGGESDENERLEGLHDAARDAPPPPDETPTDEVKDPLQGIIDAALNSPAIFAQRLKVNFGERAISGCCNGCSCPQPPA